MHPALSVVFFTTLAGAGQGLLLALVAAHWATRNQWLDAAVEPRFYVIGAALAAALATAGLVASFFHLGRPERAWRTATQWRTSWLSREVIVLPAFIGLTLAYGGAHGVARDESFLIGALAALVALALFVCTGMIYACIRFLREWATPLTPLNFTLLGCANGFTLAAALAVRETPSLLHFFAIGAIGFTLAGFGGRIAAMRRNALLVPKSTLQSAIGIKHPRIEQKSQGFMSGSFNTREFFHGRSARTLRLLRAACALSAFALPLILLVAVLAASGLGAWAFALLAGAARGLGLGISRAALAGRAIQRQIDASASRLRGRRDRDAGTRHRRNNVDPRRRSRPAVASAPFPAADRVVVLYATSPKRGVMRDTTSFLDFSAWTAESRAFTRAAATRQNVRHRRQWHA